MGAIYGLYSTGEGAIRHVEQTEYAASKNLDLIVTKALDREPGILLDWVRDQWRAGHEIRAYVLQDEIISADLEMFETYWIGQFQNLLGNGNPANPAQTDSEVGRRVNESIRMLLHGQTHASAEENGDQ